jgi:hypothetical protein
VYASAGKDGNIKLWDTTSATCISTFPAAHSGNAVMLLLLLLLQVMTPRGCSPSTYSCLQVTSVQFSRNGRYLLSCGKDSTVKLWDLSTTRPLRIYSGSVLSVRFCCFYFLLSVRTHNERRFTEAETPRDVQLQRGLCAGPGRVGRGGSRLGHTLRFAQASCVCVCVVPALMFTIASILQVTCSTGSPDTIS